MFPPEILSQRGRGRTERFLLLFALKFPSSSCRHSSGGKGRSTSPSRAHLIMFINDLTMRHHRRATTPLIIGDDLMMSIPSTDCWDRALGRNYLRHSRRPIMHIPLEARNERWMTWGHIQRRLEDVCVGLIRNVLTVEVGSHEKTNIWRRKGKFSANFLSGARASLVDLLFIPRLVRLRARAIHLAPFRSRRRNFPCRRSIQGYFYQ